MRQNVILFLFLIFSLRTYSQNPEMIFERLSVREGLSDHSINCITQDRPGFIWIGGTNGLYRYDGYEFTSYQYRPGWGNNQYFKDVYRIKEDKYGLLWMLSEIGIILFDPEIGRSVLLYPYTYEKKSIGSNYSPDIIIDDDGIIWATYREGLIKISYNDDLKKFMSTDIRGSDAFETEFIGLPFSGSGTENIVTKIYEDRDQNTIVGSISGLFLLDKEQGVLTSLNGLKGSVDDFRYVRSIVQADDNSYWIAAGDVLYNLTKQALCNEKVKDPSKEILKYRFMSNQMPISLIADSKNNVLLGTVNGIYRVIKNSKETKITFSQVDANENDPEYYGYAKTIRDIFEDRSGVIWTAQDYYGVTKFNPDGSRFNSYRNLILKDFKNTDINPIYKDNDGYLWIGSYGGGLYKIQLNDFRVDQYDMHNQRNNIICMQELSPGLFWVGTNRGITEFDASTGRSGDPSHPALNIINRREIFIWDLLKDNNLMYIASQEGLYIFDFKTKALAHYPLIKNDTLPDFKNQALSLLRMRTGEILVGTSSQGIFKINTHGSKPEIIQIADNKLLSDKGVNLGRRHRLFEDKNGALWIVDYSGLHRLDIETSEIINYRLFDEINFPDAWSIVEDSSENLWIGTHFGLCCFNKVTEKVKVYNRENGLPITIHGFNSVYKDKDGRLYFGGIGGFYDFHPESLKVNEFVPPVVITDILLFNKSLKDETDKASDFNNDIPYLRTIKLKYDQNDISIKFSALDYSHPDNNQYLYKLEGYQDQWIKTKADNRVANYLKLKPGTYLFRVRGSNSDGIWNEEGASLKIVIRKPWWTTHVALTIYLIVFISVISGIFRWRLYVLRREREHLENLIRTRTREIREHNEKISEQKNLMEKQNKKILENEELKNRFFSNISHEFRTPLSLIMSPAEELANRSRLNDKERRKLSMITRNAQRLLNLVNQLLDLSKFDENKMTLEICEIDVMKHLNNIAEPFISLAETKSIDFHFQTDNYKVVTWCDPDKIEKIATNILSNAFKFTPVGGEIEFRAKYIYDKTTGKPSLLEFLVNDNGPGIPENSLDKIFDRFFQVEESGTENIGTGIGLSLSRDLARLMHGDVTVKSGKHSGSLFTVVVPLGKEHLNENEYVEIKNRPDGKRAVEKILTGYFYSNADESDTENEKKGKPVILIVDDNKDMRNQLSDNLESTYTIRSAVDGTAGLKIAIEIIPDLIVTDLIMPKMDGIELCRQLKENEITCHIPVIMLTAKDTTDDKIIGFQTGADDYIPKPFKMPELKARIANLIDQRRQLRERFSREITLEPGEISVTSADEKFLMKAILVIEKHMKEEKFGLAEFQDELNMSRSTLFRKLSALTGQSPTEFIRTIRLKRAGELLRQGFGNISEISTEVGIYNISYFNRSFKKLFGVSPKEFAKK